MKHFCVLFGIWVVLCCGFDGSAKSRVLILSGRNNHDWKKTTLYLQKMYEESGLFVVSVTEKPENLGSSDFKGVDVVVSNWSSFPDKDYRWPDETEKALLDFIRNGGGFVTFHAATTAFYNWPEFKEFTTGAWINETAHGKQCATRVSFSNVKHPVTKGMASFTIFEELWMKAEQNSDFEVLATAVNENVTKAELEKQPVVSVKKDGKGRIFHTTLGHDTRQMRNIGFQALMLRATEWAATGKVTQKIPQQLRSSEILSGDYKWAETDTTIALINNNNVVWQYNFNEFHRKPHFHPLFIGRNNITCVSPDDHHWHAGQWFSWKYINRVNYWEYINQKEYRSEGITEIRDINFIPKADFSAEIELDIRYHPDNGENVLAEKRTVKISAPGADGKIAMDYQFVFEALVEKVELNRTPIEGEPEGKNWGGYGGLSLRFNQSFMDPKTIASWDGDDEHGKNGRWFYMGFTGIDGKQVGTQIIISPNSEREESAWYVTKTEAFPFYYYGPAYLFYKPVTLRKGERLALNYRLNHLIGEQTQNRLEKEFMKYKKQQNQ